MSHILYILRSVSTGRYYGGETSNLQRRLEFHNEDGKGFTARYRPWEVAFSMEYTSREDALASERKIKGWKSKKMIERVIQGKIVP